MKTSLVDISPGSYSAARLWLVQPVISSQFHKSSEDPIVAGVLTLGVIDTRRISLFGFDFGPVTCENTVALRNIWLSDSSCAFSSCMMWAFLELPLDFFLFNGFCTWATSSFACDASTTRKDLEV